MKNKLICKGDFFMIVKQKSKVIPIEKSSTHYKMYKGGKLWLTAGITTLSMAGMMIATGELQTAHADTTTTANNTQQTATGGNAVTTTTSGTSGQAGTITQPVNIDHSQLNNAVDQARQAGLTVNQQPTTTQTVNQDQVDAAKQNIQNDEAKQAQQIQTITRQHQTEASNVNNFNGSKGDTPQLDAKLKEAQSIPGLTVVHDQDQTTVKKLLIHKVFKKRLIMLPKAIMTKLRVFKMLSILRNEITLILKIKLNNTKKHSLIIKKI